MATQDSEKLLVVDDDAATRKLLLRTVCKTGHSCRDAGDATEALKLIHEDTPSLLLLDFDMPGMNGAEMLKALRANPDIEIAQVPTIMLTGHGGEESEVLCLEAGANDFVTKPINSAVLRARIDTQLRLRSMRQQLQQQNSELEAWRRTLERDLAAAQLTQQSLIPQKPPELEGWEVACCYKPVIQVGGDIYGWLRMVDGRMLFWMADATGHGASAALLTTLAKLLFHHGVVEHRTPAKIMQAVNSDFRSIFGGRSFMTAMCVALEPKSGAVTVVGAGHPPLLISRKNGSPETIPSSAPPLGLLESERFEEKTVDLAQGDAFILYTDGLYGGTRDASQLFAPDRLGTLLNGNAPDAAQLLEQMVERAAALSNGQKERLDDLAAVAVRRSA